MTKADELTTLTSCLNKAALDEPVFVLRAKDPAAADTIEFWMDERIRLGIDGADSQKIVSAKEDAAAFRKWREEHVDGANPSPAT